MKKHLIKIKELANQYSPRELVDVQMFKLDETTVLRVRCSTIIVVNDVWLALFSYMRKHDLRNKIIGTYMYVFPSSQEKE